MKKILLAILLLPAFVDAQRLFNLSSIQLPPTGPTIQFNASAMSFTTQAGTASATLTGVYSFFNTTAGSNSISIPSFCEASIDAGSTWHSSFSGLSNCTGCSLVVRVAAATALGSYGPTNLTLSSTTGGATSQNCSVTALVGNLSASPSSITGLNGVAGTAGTPQTVTVTFANTTVTATPPTATEVSKDGGTTYATSQTFNTGSPLALLIRTQASASARTISSSMALTATGITTVNVPISGTISSSGGKDSMRVQMYITAADTVAGWSHCFGDPSTATRSVVGGNTSTITYTEGMTTANWGQSGGACIGANNGLTSTTTWNYATGVMKEGVLNTNAMDTTKHMAQFSGLKAGSTYKVALSGVTQFNFNFGARYNVGGTTWGTYQTLNCNGVSNPNPVQLSWTVTANSSGIIYIAMGADPGTAGAIAGLLNAITITEQ